MPTTQSLCSPLHLHYYSPTPKPTRLTRHPLPPSKLPSVIRIKFIERLLCAQRVLGATGSPPEKTKTVSNRILFRFSNNGLRWGTIIQIIEASAPPPPSRSNSSGTYHFLLLSGMWFVRERSRECRGRLNYSQDYQFPIFLGLN
jgi:hypothetical protein